MAEELKDPSKPAGYVDPEWIDDDGNYLRNDGVKLKPASKNPWYVLATIFYEIPADTPFWEFDREKIAKNRRVWNAWACSAIDRKNGRRSPRKPVCQRASSNRWRMKNWPKCCDCSKRG